MSKVRVKTGNGEEVIGEFMGIFQMSDVIPPSSMVGGHTGGVVSMPVAVVKLETGELKQSKIGDVIFDVTPREEPRVHEDSMDAHSYVLRQQERLRQGYSKPTTDDELKQLKLDLNSHSGVVRKGDIASIVYHETGKPDKYDGPINPDNMTTEAVKIVEKFNKGNETKVRERSEMGATVQAAKERNR